MIGFNPIENASLMMTGFCLLVGAICELMLNRGDRHIKKIYEIDRDFICQTTIYRTGIIGKICVYAMALGFVFAFIFGMVQNL